MHEDLQREFSLESRTAVITGAASGIGRETACILARAGARLILADIDAAGLAITAGLINDQGGTAHIRPANVADRADVEALAADAAERNGVDIWINAAAIHFAAPMLEAPPAATERLLSINLLGTYWSCAAAARVMQPRGKGSIINFSSTGADRPTPGISAYAMAKAAVNMLTRTAATEFGPLGIRVNAVAPGFVDTPMVSFRYADETGAINPARREEVLRLLSESTPLGEIGTPRDIALAILYLASDASRHVTGQILRVNGGASMP